MTVPDSPLNDGALLARGVATLLACWEAIARGSSGAVVRRLPGVAAAVFPREPERSIYNNALLDRDVGPARRAVALDAMEAAYASAGVGRFAAWVHETDEEMRSGLQARGYTVAESTRAMGMCLSELRSPCPRLDLAPADWAEYVRHLGALGVPHGLLAGVDPRPFHLLLARLDGETVGTALGFDLAGDCGVFNVSTLEHARRRGIGTALTALLLHDAAARGCRTATLQATEMAERIYAAIGFRDLGRFLEYAPSPAGRASRSGMARHATSGAPAYAWAMADVRRIALISGSLRHGSTNTAVLQTAQAVAPEQVETVLYDGMDRLPHFNPDDDQEGGRVDAAVAELRMQIAAADALLICTPEYVGALPGALKNLLEWTIGDAGTYRKPVAWINASGPAAPTGGADAHDSLRKVLGYAHADIVEDACVRIPLTRQAVGADGTIADHAVRAQIAATLRTLAEHAAAREAADK